MKRKDEAEERNQVEKETQKSVERTHWTLEEKLPSTIESSSNKLKFIVEYDNTGGISGTVRQSFKNFNKKEAEDSITNSTNTKATKVNSATAEPMNKIPKLSENKNKN